MQDEAAEKLVRDQVRKFLKEDDAYGGFDIYDTNNPGGASFGSGKDLYNVFVKPFTDVVDTAVGKTKEISQRTQALAKVAFEALATSLVPFLEDDYKSIFEHEKEALEKLKAQYKDVYDATWTAFKDNDVVMAAFMYAPSAMITAKVAQQAPIQTIKVLNVLTGGKLDQFLAKVSKTLHLGDTKKPLDRDEGPGLPEGKRGAAALTELHQKPPSPGQVLTQRGIKQAIQKDPKTSQMSQATRNIVDGAIQKVVQRAQAVSSSQNLDDLQKKLGVKLKGIDKLQQVPEQERKALSAPVMNGVKKSALSVYVKGLSDQLSALQKAGVPNDHPLVKQLNSAISKIKAMA